MKFCIILSLIWVSCADELFWFDYETGYEYNWETLQHSEDYFMETDTSVVYFNLGQNVARSCQGQQAAAIKFSKAGDSCEILGRHELTYYTSFNTLETKGLVFFYEGGSLCKNRYYEDFKHRVEFKLTCSPTETEFILTTSAEVCTTIFEKNSATGCPKEYEYSILTKILFVLFYALIAFLLIWLCYEAIEPEEFSDSSWSAGSIISKTKIVALGKQSYNSV